MEKIKIEEMMKWENEFFKRQFPIEHLTDSYFAEYWDRGDAIPFRASMSTYSYFISEKANLAIEVSRLIDDVNDLMLDYDILFLGTPWTLEEVEGGWNLSARFRCFNSDKREWNNEPKNYVVAKEEDTNLSEEAILKALVSIDITSPIIKGQGIPVFKSLTDDINWFLEEGNSDINHPLHGLSFISDIETTEKLGIPKKLLEG